MSSALSRPQLDLVDALDRTLGTGVVVAGDLTLSLADVDLVHVSLRALLASVATLERDSELPEALTRSGSAGPRPAGPRPAEPGRVTRLPPPPPAGNADDAPPGADSPRDREERLEQGLVRLVLTVVELLRQLLERQALRRVEAGSLDEEQIERLGRALERLQAQMEELKRRFDVADDDLALRLGPLPLDDLKPYDEGGE